MKHILFSTVLLAILITIISCSQSPSKINDQTISSSSESNSEQKLQEKQHDTDSTTLTPLETKKDSTVIAKKTNFSIASIVSDYLVLKNALVKDDSKITADAGKQLFSTVSRIELKSIPADKQKDYLEITENVQENAKHISDNAKDIGHQREHLASLSKDIRDLIEIFGSPQKLYQVNCPMYNDNKGAIWISEIKEIKNPYYGSKMSTCGSIKKEY